MRLNFLIAKYKKENNSFSLIGYDEYGITYLKGRKIFQLRVVVEGYLTKVTVDLINFKDIKNKLLLAIKEYNENSKLITNRVNKKISMSFMKQYYSKNIVVNAEKHLNGTKKENSRDKLTKYNLISNGNEI